MYQAVISSNFDAVALLRYGHFDESTFLLRNALSRIQAFGRLASLTHYGSPALPPKVTSVSLRDAKGSLCSSPVSSTFHVECFDIFAQAFIVEDAGLMSYTDETASTCASVCLYNMALGMHLKGLSLGVAAHIRKASGLYQKVFSVLSTFVKSSSDPLSSLLLGTVLNIVSCESYLRSHAVAEEWKIVYSNLFVWATQSTEYPAIADQPEEMAFFVNCAVFLSNQDIIAASAA